ncbi:MAG: hypothetical protein H6811_09355 [Phycisphaeraceae bacterium]|nr:hypothetical protein [Phycisphaeraceae bacterium]
MSAIGAVAADASRPGGFASLSSDEFLRIIFQELGRQDPLKPNDTGALLQQLADIRSIESDVQLGAQLEALGRNSEFATSAGLIGHAISGVTEDAERAAGIVVSVVRRDEGAVLTIDTGQRIPMAQVDEIVRLDGGENES